MTYDDFPVSQASRVTPHVHHRALLTHAGIAVGYWACDRSTAPDHHCEDGPDPQATLIRRIAERPLILPRHEEPTRDPRRRTCKHPDSERFIRVEKGKDRIRCRACQREYDHRSRAKKAAA